MPVLTNARYERFAQELAKGRTADEAYVRAGFSKNRGNASRLKSNESVAARIAEIQGKAAEQAIVTVNDIVAQLDEDRLFARELEAPAAAISATMGKAKVLGHLSDKIEHTGKDGGPIQVEDLSDMDALRRVRFLMNKAKREAPTIN